MLAQNKPIYALPRSDRCREQVRLLWALLIVVAGLFTAVTPARAAVTLTYFRAFGELDQVRLEWETATELNNAGFFVQRSASQFGAYNRISQFIPSEGDGLTGAQYEFVDVNVVNGTIYWYKLEAVDYNQSSELYGPIPAVPGVTSTGTSTATSTPTATTPVGATVTHTSTPTVSNTPPFTLTPTIQPSPTRSPIPTATNPYPAPVGSATPPPILPSFTPLIALLTPTDTLATGVTVTSTESVSGTATLIPLPAITMQFPDGTRVSRLAQVSTASPTSQPALALESPREERWRAISRLAFLGVIVLIWLILGGWFYLSMRRVS